MLAVLPCPSHPIAQLLRCWRQPCTLVACTVAEQWLCMQCMWNLRYLRDNSAEEGKQSGTLFVSECIMLSDPTQACNARSLTLLCAWLPKRHRYLAGTAGCCLAQVWLPHHAQTMSLCPERSAAAAVLLHQSFWGPMQMVLSC